MKTLSKILISILALALCIGAAAVTVFAAEETSFVTVGLGDFEEATVGQSLTGSSSNTNIDGVLFAVNGRRGQYTVTQAENGNKYIVHSITSETLTTNVPYMSINEKAPTQSANYGDAALSNNLFYSIDFDMMTPTGSYPMHPSGNITMQVAPYFERYDASFNRATDGTASVLTFGGTGRNTWTQGSNSYVMDTTAGEWHPVFMFLIRKYRAFQKPVFRFSYN